MKTVIVIVILIALIFCAGCEDMGVSVTYDDTITPSPTATRALTNITRSPTPTTPIPTITIPTPEPTEIMSVIITPSAYPYPTTAITQTPVVHEEVTIPNSSYKSYSDTDFKVEYPDSWIVKQSVIPANQKLLGAGKLKTDSRAVIFEGNTKSVNFTVITSDFITNGNYNLIETMSGWQNTITSRFPDVSGAKAMTNFDVKQTGLQTRYVTFDITIPQGSVVYPHAYTERDLASYTHFYTVRFNTPGTLGDYKTIKDHMFATLQTEERAKP